MQVFSNIKASILERSKTIKSPKERSTIQKPLIQAENMLNSQKFLDNLSHINSLLKGNELPLQLQEIRTLIQYAGSKFNIETGRAFQKYKETQALSIALYYDSWWPFIQHATASKEGKTHNIALNIPEGMKIIDKNSHEVVLHAATVVIPLGDFKAAQEIVVQTVVQPQPRVEDSAFEFQFFDDSQDSFQIFDDTEIDAFNVYSEN